MIGSIAIPALTPPPHVFCPVGVRRPPLGSQGTQSRALTLHSQTEQLNSNQTKLSQRLAHLTNSVFAVAVIQVCWFIKTSQARVQGGSRAITT